MSTAAERLRDNGWALLPSVLAPSTIEQLRDHRNHIDVVRAVVRDEAVVGILDALCSRWCYVRVHVAGRGSDVRGWHVDVGRSTCLPPQPFESGALIHAIWALDSFTEDNGATELIDREGQVVRAIMPAGAGFAFVASELRHRAGPNPTGKPRWFLVVQYRGELKQ